MSTTPLIAWTAAMTILTAVILILEHSRNRHSRRAAIACDVCGALWIGLLVVGLLVVVVEWGGGMGADGRGGDDAGSMDSRAVSSDEFADATRTLTAAVAGGWVE